jgi:hypothetical protein
LRFAIHDLRFCFQSAIRNPKSKIGRPFEPDADNTDEGRNKMTKELKEKSSDEVKLPASRKIYVETNGNTINQNKHNLRVPFREIALSPSKDFDGELEENPPVRVYDTSGVWTRTKNATCAKACRSFAGNGL